MTAEMLYEGEYRYTLNCGEDIDVLLKKGGPFNLDNATDATIMSRPIGEGFRVDLFNQTFNVKVGAQNIPLTRGWSLRAA